MIRRHINFYKKMHKFSHLCTKIHCDKTGFAQKFTAFAQIFTPKFTKIHCIYLLYMLFIRLNVGRASYLFFPYKTVLPRSARSTGRAACSAAARPIFEVKRKGSYKSHPSYFIYTIYYRNSDKCTQFDF